MFKTIISVISKVLIVIGLFLSTWVLSPNLIVAQDEDVNPPIKEPDKEPDKEPKNPLEEELPPEKEDLVLLESDYSLVEGQNTQILIDKEKSAIDVLLLDFISVNESIAKVDKNGLVSGISPGTTQIEIVHRGYVDPLAVVTINVTALVGTVSFIQPPGYLNRVSQYTLKYEVSESIRSFERVWTSSNSSVISVDQSGVIKANKIGEATIKLQVGDFFAEKKIRVKAPLEKIDFNGDSFSLELNASANFPDIIFVPYDTTDDKSVSYASSDSSIFAIEDNKVVAKSVGEAQLIAKVGKLETALTITITPIKNSNGAEIVYLNHPLLEEGKLILSTDNLESYSKGPLALLFDEEVMQEYMSQVESGKVVVKMHERLTKANMKELESFIIYPEIFEMIAGKNLEVRLETLKGDHIITYQFDEVLKDSVNLKFNLSEIKEDHRLYGKIQTKSYALDLYNGNTSKYKITLPASKITSQEGQMHFIYNYTEEKIVDTMQNPRVGQDDYITFDVDSNHTIITFNRINVISNKGLLLSLSLVAGGLLLWGVIAGRKAYKKDSNL